MPLSSAAYNYLNELHTKEGLIAITQNGFILAANNRAKELLGISKEDNSQELTFPDSFLFYQLDDNNEVQQYPCDLKQFDLYIETKKEYILGIKTDSGQLNWICTSFKRFKDKKDTYIIISFLDYTTIVNQNLILQRKNHEQQILVSSLNDLVFEVSDEGEFLHYWTNNPELLFFKPEEFLNKKIKDLFPVEISKITTKLISQTLKEQTQRNFVFQNPLNDRDKHWFEMHIKPVYSNTTSVLLIIADITAEIEAKKLVKINEHKFDQAFHYSGVGSSLTSIDGSLINGNKTLFEILGYTKSDFEQIKSIDITHPDDKKKDISARNAILKGKRKYSSFEKRYKHKNGHYIWCHATISLVRDDNDCPLFFIVQLQDITKSKRNTLKLEKQNIELRNIKLELESKIVQLEESNYILAHNLKSPASNIAMLIEHIASETNPNIQKDLWFLLEKSSHELSETLHDLNQVLKIKQDASQIFEYCNFSSITDQVILLYKEDIERKNIDIQIDFDLDEIYYPKIYLESIIDNLISNSIKFSNLNQEDPPFIKIKTYKSDNCSILEVQDNGIGIDLEKFKSQLFMFRKIFHRGFNDKGIGLFMVKYYVETLGGKIDVESKVNVGTTFFIKFSETY